MYAGRADCNGLCGYADHVRRYSSVRAARAAGAPMAAKVAAKERRMPTAARRTDARQTMMLRAGYRAEEYR